MRKSLSITFISKFLSALLNLYIITLLSQHLGAEGKGVCSLILTIVSIGQVVCDIVGGSSLTYLAPKVNFKKLLFQAYLWIFVISIFAEGFAFLQFGKDSGFFLHIFALNFLNAAIGTHQNILIGLKKFKTSAILGFLQVLVISISLFFFLKFDVSVTSYVVALYVSWITFFIIGLLIVLNTSLVDQPSLGTHNIYTAFKFGFINQFAHILQFVNLRLSYFLLPAFALGVFSNATSISESLWLISSSVSSILYGSISNSEVKNKNVNLTVRSIKYVFIATIFGAIALSILPSSFYVWLFGIDFSETKQIILFMLPGILFFGIYLIPGHFFSGSGNFMTNIWCIGVGLLITIISIAACFALKINFNPTTAAIITSASYFGNMITAIILFNKETGTTFRNLIPNVEDLKGIKKMLIKH